MGIFGLSCHFHLLFLTCNKCPGNLFLGGQKRAARTLVETQFKMENCQSSMNKLSKAPRSVTTILASSALSVEQGARRECSGGTEASPHGSCLNWIFQTVYYFVSLSWAQST